nr:hypothetical protein [Tanacetum cinerariifolium]
MDVRRIEEEVDPDFLLDAHSRTGLAESGDSCESKDIFWIVEWIVRFPFYLLFADIVDTGWCLRFMRKQTNVNARSHRSTKVDESKLCDIPVVCNARTLIIEEAHATKYFVRPGTDGQSQRTFRTLENMFRACVRNLVVVGILTFREADIKESKMIGLELEQETTKVVTIKERPKEAKDRQES